MKIIENTNYLPITTVFNIKTGYTPATNNPDYWTNGDIPWFKMHDLKANGLVLDDAIIKTTKLALKNGKTFAANSIILATTATIGIHALITKEFLCNQQFSVFELKPEFKDQVSMEFMNHYFYVIDQWCKNNTNVSAFPAVKMDDLKKLKIPIPPLATQVAIATALDQFVHLNDQLNQELALRQKQYQYYLKTLLDFANPEHPFVKNGGGH